jgi:glycerol kinase
VKGAVFGLTFATTRAHLLRAALESIAYQIKDLIDAMTRATGAPLKEICADGGPTKNAFLMQFQADLLQTPIICTEVDDASALGAALMNGFARGVWHLFDEVLPLRKVTKVIRPQADAHDALYTGWLQAVRQLIK